VITTTMAELVRFFLCLGEFGRKIVGDNNNNGGTLKLKITQNN